MYPLGHQTKHMANMDHAVLLQMTIYKISNRLTLAIRPTGSRLLTDVNVPATISYIGVHWLWHACGLWHHLVAFPPSAHSHISVVIQWQQTAGCVHLHHTFLSGQI